MYLKSAGKAYTSSDLMYERIDADGLNLAFRHAEDDANTEGSICITSVEEAEWLCSKLESFIMESTITKMGGVIIKDEDGNIAGVAITKSALRKARPA